MTDAPPASGTKDTPGQSDELAELPPIARKICGFSGFLIGALALLWAADVARYFGLVFYTEQYLGAILGLTLLVAYIRFPLTGKTRTTVPWYDWCAAALSAVAAFYIAWDYPDLSMEMSYRPTYIVAISTILVVLGIEALRRGVGLPLTIVVLVFVAYGILGHLIPGQLGSRHIDPSRLMVYLGLDANAMLGTPLIVGATIIIPFIFMGQLLFRSGGSGFFTDLSMALMGRFRGGSAKIAIAASALFGSISGSAVSNVATTGVITIPLMRDSGYPGRSAAAIEAVASTGGQLMPPIMGAAAFLMAELLQIPYTEVLMAALVPSLLYFAALFIQADLDAAKIGIKAIDPARIPPLGRVLREGWQFVLPFVALVVGLFKFNLAPEMAALVAAIFLLGGGLIRGYQGRRLGWGDALTAIRATGLAVVDLILICTAAGIVIGVLNLTGLGFGLTLSLAQIGGNSLLALLAISAVLSIFLGMGMPTVGVYVLLATLIAPSLIELGVEPLAAHMFVMYFGMMSMITPPVAIAAFAAASLANEKPMATGVTAVRFAWSAYIVPFLFVLSPALLLQGTLADVAVAVVTALGGVWCVSVALAGFFRDRISWSVRALFAVAGMLLLFPAKASGLGLWINVGGIAAALVLVVLMSRSQRETTPTHPT